MKWYQRDGGELTELPDINEENIKNIVEEKSLMYNDIHRIFRWDEKYLKFLKKKKAIKALFTKMQEFQYDLAEKNLDQGKFFTDYDINRKKSFQVLDIAP